MYTSSYFRTLQSYMWFEILHLLTFQPFNDIKDMIYLVPIFSTLFVHHPSDVID